MEVSHSLIELAVSMANQYGQQTLIGTLAFKIAMQNARHDVDRHNNSLDYLQRLLDQSTILTENDRNKIEVELQDRELIRC